MVLERFDLRNVGFCPDHRGHSVQTVYELAVDWMLDPKRAILVKGGNTVFWRN
jgi:hypothetical protein